MTVTYELSVEREEYVKKIGSEFLKEFGNEEKEVMFGLTFRMLVFALVLILVVAVAIVVIFLELPDIYIYIVCGTCLVPAGIYGLGFSKEFQLKDKIRFFLTTQDRTFETEFRQGERYSKDEFVQIKKRKARKG